MVKDLELVLKRIGDRRQKFASISDEELMRRKLIIKELKHDINNMKSVVNGQRTIQKLEKDERDELTRWRKEKRGAGGAAGEDRNASFMQGQQQTQSMMHRQQDEHLGDMEMSLHRLGEMGRAINVEIDEQNRMLEDLDEDLDKTQGRMEGGAPFLFPSFDKKKTQISYISSASRRNSTSIRNLTIKKL